MVTIIPNNICANLSPAEIEQILTDHQGRAEIFEDGIHLCSPEYHLKNILDLYWECTFITWSHFPGEYAPVQRMERSFETEHCSRRMYLFGPTSDYCRETAQHLYQDGTVPKLVMECEWHHERNMPKKAFDKVLNYYFSDDYIGLDDIHGHPTRVEEAWIFIIHPDREVVPKGRRYRMKCWWGYIPIVNEILITIVNLFVGIVFSSAEDITAPSGSMWRSLWTLLVTLARYLCWMVLDVVPERPAPPTDPLVPYIAIYFRHDKSRPTFCHLYPDQVFIAPSNSTLSMMEPLCTNRLLSMY